MARLFNARETLPRMLLLILSGLGYLLVVCGTQNPPTGPQWALAVLAFVSGLLLHRHRPANLLAQAALFAVSLVVLDDPTISQVGTAWALGELAFWAPRPAWVGAGAGLVSVIYLTLGLPHADSIGEGLAGLTTNLAVPILLGTVGRTTAQLGEQEARRVESEQRAARADERSAIARELHDVVAHHIASMVLRVGVGRHVLPDLDPRVAEIFDDVHRTGSDALGDLRRLVTVLRDPDEVRRDASLTAIEPSALPAALAGAVEKARLAGVNVEAEIDPSVGGLDAVRGLAVLRLTQEALTNVAKHAGPSATARLRVTLTASDVDWEVTDDGGLPGTREVPSGGGHGLTGMRERAEVLGGTLSAGPSGKGWRVATMLPGETA
ncbi:sensor histidine kinase [Actinoplanes derwentensis]|uniref:histidine kinase n=1 Tax=Actinoplanes derwentensis TaxID=113562 RepID=A0A1H2D950_9ACTN|nr:histidine kinase [Actinoplanes derwentensis]GID86251.1 two-component sensor histidine kinase [Actinoplanes derwentensis]SDT78776.1 Signal transduction histidine kinase [Actinoplanes derwentensis]